MDDELAAVMGLSGFGQKQSKHRPDASRFDKNKRPSAPDPGPAPPPAPRPASDTRPSTAPETLPRSDSESDHESQIGPEPVYDPEAPELIVAEQDSLPAFPVSHELPLKDHTKVISALAMDPSGARLLTGSHDYDCKLWDFGGMDSRCKPFRSWEPAGSYYINDLKFSNRGDKFLVISGTSQAKLYERDGEEICTFIKGDPYIRDMKNTSGHVADISSCMWHPNDPQLFITASADSTIRIWDVENKRKQKTVIVVKSKERGARTRITSCAYSGDAKVIVGGCLDGALHIWNTSSNYVRPSMSIEGAHRRDTEIGSAVFSMDGRTILTRGGDDTVKLWDMRKFRQPICERNDLVTLYPGTNATFSPEEKYIVTGTGLIERGAKGKGQLHFMDRSNLKTLETVNLDSTAVKVLWHPRINQVIAGTAAGQVTVLFSPSTSSNGAKLIANKGGPKKPTVESLSAAVLAPTIIAPHALPMFKDGDDIISAIGSATKRKRDKERNDPRKSRRPELPVVGPGKGGRVGASATQHVVQNLFRDTTRDVDPREALLKYADEKPEWTKAWNNSGQVFADEDKAGSDEGEER